MATVASGDLRERIVALREKGLTQQKIADEVGRSRSYVQKVLASEKRVSRPTLARAVSIPRQSGRASSNWLKAEGSSVEVRAGDVLPPTNPVDEWTSYGLDRDTWTALGKGMTLPLLAALSPGISRAVWDYLRMLDPGHEIEVLRMDSEEIHEQGAAVLSDFIRNRVDPMHGSMKSVFEQMFMGALYRGAFCVQVVTDDKGRAANGILIPDPSVIRFQAVESEEYGMLWEPGIVVEGKWESVESPMFRYVAVERAPGQPYGKSMIASATFPAIFMIGLLYDLRRVVAQQGYPRTDITILATKLRELYEGDDDEEGIDDDEFNNIVENLIDEVARSYSSLQPDDAFIHTDSVEVSTETGAVDSGVIAGAVALIDKLEGMEVRALKTMPLLMGITDGVSEANANRQWEIHAAGIKSLQQYAESAIGGAFETVLRLNGIQAKVKVRFAEIRSAEMLRDEQTAKIKMENAAFAEDRGWMSAEEASIYAVGHEPEGEVVANPPSAPGGSEPSDVIPEDEDAGVEPERFARSRGRRRAKVTRRSLDLAVASWESAFGGRPERTMMNAVHVATREQIPEDSDHDWYWVTEDREFVYRNVDVLDTAACRDVLDWYVERVQGRVEASIEQGDADLRSRASDIRALMEDAWLEIEPSLIAGVALGYGGIEGFGSDAYAAAELLVDEQRAYWSDFTADMVDEDASSDDWSLVRKLLIGRAVLYVAASSLGYERGRADVWRVELPDTPPLHPGCGCYVEYGEDTRGVWARWVAMPTACDDCVEMAEKYRQWRG